jgi:hypothetical protein
MEARLWASLSILWGKEMAAWFVPPIVIPAMLVIATIALALLR